MARRHLLVAVNVDVDENMTDEDIMDVINVHLDLADLTEDIDLSAVEFVSAIGVKGWRHGPSVTNG